MFEVRIGSLCRRRRAEPAFKLFLPFITAAFVFGGAHAETALQEKQRDLSDQIPKEQLPETLERLPRDLDLAPLNDLPDLIALVRPASTNIQHGDEVELQIELKNIGDAPADFSPDGEESSDVVVLHVLRFELQESLGDALGDRNDADNDAEVLATLSGPTLIAPRESVRETHSLTVQNDFVAGVHNVCVVADPDDLVRESNEENNRHCVKLHLNIRPDPAQGLTKPQRDLPVERFPDPELPDRAPAVEPEPEPEDE